MTREEQIAVASCAYGTRGSSIDFTAGAKWADNHPKSPWISVEDDLPCYHPELMRNEVYTKKIIVLLNDGRIRETDMFYDKWTQYRKKITHWQPFIEPTKE